MAARTKTSGEKATTVADGTAKTTDKAGPSGSSASNPEERNIETKAAAPTKPQPELQGSGGPRAIAGTAGVVTSVEQQATRAGVSILEQGGNAVDAAVATAYALSVTHPSAGNLGGGGFMLVRPPGGPTLAIDFRETAPARVTQPYFDAMIARGAYGASAVAVPGSVAGLNLALHRFGRLSRAKVMRPAIELAKGGFRLSKRQALALGWSWPKLRQLPQFRRLYENHRGASKGTGARIKNPELARTLEAIRDRGDAGFYAGWVAEELVSSLQAGGGIIELADLADYAAKERQPLTFEYHGYQVQTMPPPSAGGVALAQTLLMLDALEAHAEPRQSADRLHLLAEAARRAHAERRFSVRDPETRPAAENKALIERWTQSTPWLEQKPIDRNHASSSALLHPLYAKAVLELEHTTHLSVVDRDGMAVSLTTTLSASFGAKIVAGKTGVILNNALASFATAGDNLPAPSRRTVSSMAPTIVASGEQTVLVLGSPGGDTIPNTVVQVLTNIVDYGMDLDAAVEAPRIHHGFVPDEIRYERRRPLEPQVISALSKLGHKLSRPRSTIGDANNILIRGPTAFAYADSREGGLALAAGSQHSTENAASN